jgi:hypothetical protein
MKRLLIGTAWVIIVIAIYALTGCGEVTVNKEYEKSGFFCFGVCTQKTTTGTIEATRTPSGGKQQPEQQQRGGY